MSRLYDVECNANNKIAEKNKMKFTISLFN